MDKEFKPLTISDFGLSPEQMKTLVTGAQKFYGPAETEQPEPGVAAPDASEIKPNADRSIR